MIPSTPPPILCIVGPTSSGKSEVALALARAVGGEVVSADAFQVYRGMDLGTGKLSAQNRDGIRHHLLDVAGPGEEYSLGRFVREAEEALLAIRGRGNFVVLSGGTGLYVRGLLRGIFEGPGRDAALRERLTRIADRGGLPRLHALLRSADPVAAGRILPGDRNRVFRALEVYRDAGSSLTSLQTQWDAPSPRHDARVFGLSVPRPVLRERIEARVRRMWEEGFLKEVAALLNAGVSPESNAFRALGYREAAAVLAGRMTEEAARARMVTATRRYAKRQEAWFRRERGILWIDACRPAADVATEVAVRAGLPAFAGRAPPFLRSRSPADGSMRTLPL